MKRNSTHQDTGNIVVTLALIGALLGMALFGAAAVYRSVSRIHHLFVSANVEDRGRYFGVLSKLVVEGFVALEHDEFAK